MNENFEVKKTTLYVIGITILVILGGFFIFNNDNVEGNAVEVNSNEDFQEITIGMKNYNYYPNTINVESGKPVRIRLDESVYGCFRDFTIREFGIRKYLRTPKDTVEFTPTKPGTYTFACSMGMGTGTLVVG